METMSAHEAARRFHTPHPAPPRRALGAVVVAGVYMLLVLGAPLILRYGPEPEVAVAVGRVSVHDAAPRCANAPEFGRSCALPAADTTTRGRLALFVP